MNSKHVTTLTPKGRELLAQRLDQRLTLADNGTALPRNVSNVYRNGNLTVGFHVARGGILKALAHTANFSYNRIETASNRIHQQIQRTFDGTKIQKINGLFK